MTRGDARMNFRPGIGKTPDDWAEEEARRRERRERVHNPYGREMGHRTRLVLTIVIGVGLVAMVLATLLGLFGVVDIFETPSA